MIELQELRKKIARDNPKALFFTNLEDVLFSVVKHQPSDKFIEQYLLTENANIGDLLSYIISNWKFGSVLGQQDENFIKCLNEIIK